MMHFIDAMAASVATGGRVNVGFLEGATYPNGVSVPMVAAIQEFGAPKVGIPPRPYFRTMIQKHKNEWGPEMAALLPANNYNGQKVLTLMGLHLKSELQESIFDLLAPELSPVTLMLRMMKKDDPDLIVNRTVVGIAAARVAAGERATGVSTKPLVETGHLSNSVDFEVK